MNDVSTAVLDFDQVLLNLAEGAPTLKRACAFEGAPRPYQVLARAEAEPDFDTRLRAAFAAGGDSVHDVMVQTELGVLTGKCQPAAAAAALSSMRWRLERLDRKRWGAKVELSSDPDHPLQVVITRHATDMGK